MINDKGYYNRKMHSSQFNKCEGLPWITPNYYLKLALARDLSILVASIYDYSQIWSSFYFISALI